jgi:hypothetical protein
MTDSGFFRHNLGNICKRQTYLFISSTDLAEIGKILNKIKEGVVSIIKRMQKNDATSADDAKIKSDLVEKLRIELQKKDEELANERQEKQVHTFYDL